MLNIFAQRIIQWFDQHGRTDLPWQQNPTSYRVWVSEIMLQQTQVNTVIPYYARFMQRFPDVASLAAAPLDDVLHHWSGLGYYARARNLHRTAGIIVSEGGQFPSTLVSMQALPGIGRSTAGAILSLAQGQPMAILDGNVKRVLARHQAIAGWPGQAQVLRQLWDVAEANTPSEHTAVYNQAMMDLGATLCTRSNPACDRCPVASSCRAYASGDWSTYPGKKPAKSIPVRTVQMLILRDLEGQILLEKRPPQGIWGGLWSLPEIPTGHDPEQWCLAQGLGLPTWQRDLSMRRHTFSHFHLDISPREYCAEYGIHQVLEADTYVWYNPHQPESFGFAAPVSRLIQELDIPR